MRYADDFVLSFWVDLTNGRGSTPDCSLKLYVPENEKGDCFFFKRVIHKHLQVQLKQCSPYPVRLFRRTWKAASPRAMQYRMCLRNDLNTGDSNPTPHEEKRQTFKKKGDEKRTYVICIISFVKYVHDLLLFGHFSEMNRVDEEFTTNLKSHPEWINFLIFLNPLVKVEF